MSTSVIIAFLFSNFMATITAFLIQILVREYSVFQIIFLNAGLFLLFSIPYNKIKNRDISCTKRDIIVNCITGTMFFISMSFWYVGLRESSLVEATTLKFLTPMFIMFFSCILTNKQLKYQDLVIMVFSIISSCILCFYGNLNKLGLFSILMSVVFSTIFHVSSRMFRTDNLLFRSIMIRLISLVISFIICCLHYKELAVMSTNYILLFALLFITSNIYLLLSNRLNMCKDIEYLQPLNLVRIIFAITIEYYVNNIVPSTYIIFGILIIVFIMLVMSIFKRYESKLIKQNNELQKLIQENNNLFIQIVHDLKTPVSIIKMSNNVIKDKMLNNNMVDSQTKEMNTFFTFIDTNVDKLKDNIDNILKLKHFENAKNIELKLEDVNIELLIKEAVDNVSLIAQQKNINITIHNDGNNNIFFIDKTKFLIVLNNLLSNAVKFARHNITITYLITNNILTLSIKNDGEVISDAIKDKILNNYDIVALLQENSTGFGFKIISHLLTVLNGTLSINNTQGNTEFVIKFKK